MWLSILLFVALVAMPVSNADSWEEREVVDMSTPPVGCECMEWAPKDAPTDLAASWGKEFSYCRFNDPDRNQWRPSTYDDGMGGVQQCCKWRKRRDGFCGLNNRYECPFGQFTTGESGLYNIEGYSYYIQVYRCFTFSTAWSLGIGIVSILGSILIVGLYQKYKEIKGRAAFPVELRHINSNSISNSSNSDANANTNTIRNRNIDDKYGSVGSGLSVPTETER